MGPTHDVQPFEKESRNQLNCLSSGITASQWCFSTPWWPDPALPVTRKHSTHSSAARNPEELLMRSAHSYVMQFYHNSHITRVDSTLPNAKEACLPKQPKKLMSLRHARSKRVMHQSIASICTTSICALGERKKLKYSQFSLELHKFMA